MKLKVGLVGEGVYAEVLEEMLCHQGIMFERIGEREIVNVNKTSRFPCIILTDTRDKTHDLVKKYSLSDDKVISIKDELPLDDIFLTLAGFSETLYLENELMKAMINEFELKLLERIREIYYAQNMPLVRKWYWPDFKRLCSIVTHDVDLLNNPPSTQKLLNWIRYFFMKYVRRKSCNNINDILYEEKERGIVSSFYFFSKYKGYLKEFLEIIDKIQMEDFEIGLHGSLFSFQNPKILEQELEKLQRLTKTKISGERQHGLNFLVPYTWRYQEEAGLDYDLSFYYNDEFGFRAGLCFPYHPFDILTKTKLNILEIPTSFMDWTGINKNMNYTELFKVVKELAKTIEKYNGCFVLNFHGVYIDKKNYPSIERLFRETLDYLNKKGYWVTTGRECANWWRRRENAKIDLELKRNEIVGRTDTPLPLIIEQSEKDSKYINVKNKFTIRISGE